jgi:serine/threonine protein kinase
MTGNSLQRDPEVLGDYELLAKIAEGGAGTVYRGRHRQTDQVVAIKVMLPSMTDNQVLLQRFVQEFRAASTLCHPNIVRALDFCWEGSRPFLVMEFIEGESLGEKIERDGRLTEAEAVGLIVQVCQGLHQAHQQGIIHRDVKPDNIVVTPDGQAKLTDLGLVKELLTDISLTRTGRGLGTPHFMAPEQFRNAKHVDARSDVYSLGATLYQMVTGQIPFGNCSPMDAWMKKTRNQLQAPRRLIPTLSERTDKAIRRAMSVDPSLRQASCMEFAADLTGLGILESSAPAPAIVNPDRWYVMYQKLSGVLKKITGNTQDLRRRFEQGELGREGAARASRSPSGPFEPLARYPEFRDLVPPPAGEGSPHPRPRALFSRLVLVTLAGIAALLAGFYLFHGI